MESPPLRLGKDHSADPLRRNGTAISTFVYQSFCQYQRELLRLKADALSPLEGVGEAYIFGSWAARYAGEAGPPPHDVDVLVVGDADDDDLADAARAAERRLGREVNIHRVSARGWRSSGDDPFLASVRSRPLYPIVDPGDPA